jgi:hypothetical protein
MALFKYDLEALKQEIARREKIQEHKGFLLPDDVWKNVFSYLSPSIGGLVDNLPLTQLRLLYQNLFNRYFQRANNYKIPLEVRRSWHLKGIYKKHREDNIRDLIVEKLQIKQTKHEDAIHQQYQPIECVVGDVFLYTIQRSGNTRHRDEEIDEYYCMITKVNKKTYSVQCIKNQHLWHTVDNNPTKKGVCLLPENHLDTPKFPQDIEVPNGTYNLHWYRLWQIDEETSVETRTIEKFKIEEKALWKSERTVQAGNIKDKVPSKPFPIGMWATGRNKSQKKDRY